MAIKQDLIWLAKGQVYSHCVECSLVQWLDLIKYDPYTFINNVKKYSQTPFANLHACSEPSDVPTPPPQPMQ